MATDTEYQGSGGKEGDKRLFELPPDALAKLSQSGVKPTDDSAKFNAAPIHTVRDKPREPIST